MQLKRYHNDPAKQKQRELLKEFIRKNLGHLPPEKLKVLHFPGPDSMEAKEVYLPMGIPPQNIIGFEMDPKLAELAKKATPDITVYNCNLEDWLSRQPMLEQNIISLDFTQNFSLSTRELLKSIVSKKSDHYAFHVALQKRRENFESQLYIGSAELHHMLSSHLESEVGISPTYGDKNLEEYLSGNFSDMRSKGLTTLLLTYVTDPSHNAIRQVFQKSLMDRFDESFNLVKNAYLKMLDVPDDIRSAVVGGFSKKTREMFTPAGIEKKMSETGIRFLLGYAADLIGNRLYSSMRDLLNNIRNITQPSETNQISIKIATPCSLPPRTLGFLFLGAMASRERGASFSVSDVERYQYVSESGAPMIGDMLMIRKDWKLMKAREEFLEQISLNGSFDKSYQITNPKGFTNSSIKVASMFVQGAGFSSAEEERTDLGSSARPILSKKKALELLDSGMSPQEILEKYRVNPRKLAAWRAHRTMGTYGTNNGGAGLESLNKEEALEFIKDDVPLAEIHDAYPGTSMAKLNAWKYWLGKGAYAK